MADTENKQQEQGQESTQKQQEQGQGQERKQEPAQPAPAADPLASILNLLTQQSAAMAALEQRVSALQNQQAVDSSIAHEANGGHGIPTNTDPGQGEGEGGEDYPEIDLEEISRMIGDY